jgi:hypothetical protein
MRTTLEGIWSHVLEGVATALVLKALIASGRVVWRWVNSLWAHKPRGAVWPESDLPHRTLLLLAQHAALTRSERQPNHLRAR